MVVSGMAPPHAALLLIGFLCRVGCSFLQPGTMHAGGLAITSRVRRGGPLAMGVSDRMATDGVLYEEWGKEGMRVLNKSSTLLEGGINKGLSRYELVLTVAQRAKENTFQSTEDDEGYPGAAGGAMGKLRPQKSEVVAAVEELVIELEETGKLPDLADFDDQGNYLEPTGYRTVEASPQSWAEAPPPPRPPRAASPKAKRAKAQAPSPVEPPPPVSFDLEEDLFDDALDLVGEGMPSLVGEEELVGKEELVGQATVDKGLAEELVDDSGAVVDGSAATERGVDDSASDSLLRALLSQDGEDGEDAMGSGAEVAPTPARPPIPAAAPQ